MDFYSVVDPAALIWDEEKFDVNATPYYELADELLTFFSVIESEKDLKVLMRSQLQDELMTGFPYNRITGIPNFWEVSTEVFKFIGGINHRIIDFEENAVQGVVSKPDIVYEYYSQQIKNEVYYLISQIHTDVVKSVFFTFLPIWVDNDTQLETQHTETKEYQTIIQLPERLKLFFDSIKPKFEHNPKHDHLIRQKDIARGFKLVNGEEIYPLSCYNGKDIITPQKLLSKAIPSEIEPDKLFSFDEDNQTYVCFVKTGGNIYHGYDQPLNRIHDSVKIKE